MKNPVTRRDFFLVPASEKNIFVKMHPDDFFQTPVEFLKGVGPQRAQILKEELNIITFGDLLRHYPFRYVDRTKFYKISETTEDTGYVQLRGKISAVKAHGLKRTTRVSAVFTDATGNMDLVWFQGLRWIRTYLKPGTEYVIYGKPALFNSRLNIVHPEIEEAALADARQGPSLHGVYPSTEKSKSFGLDSKGILKIIRNLIMRLPAVPETLPGPVINNHRLLPLREALINIHVPADDSMLESARFRLKFDELFYIQLRILRGKSERNKNYRGKPVEKIGEKFNTFFSKHLPFGLTNAQKRVLKEIRNDMGRGVQMNRLLQGDVGSGKTIVALLSMLMVIDNGMQACLMAPTEILASQHYQSLFDLLKESKVNIVLLTGSTKSAQRKFILSQLSEGKIDIIIGTHALIEDRVVFQNLGLVVIDEQHRFGVQQRGKLWMKGAEVPHVLVMTATPIPRTLAMTLYGDLDTSVIDELPPGRKPIRTIHKNESARLGVWGFMKEEISKGRQVYVVYPLIEESEKLDYNNLVQGYESICTEFPLPQYRVSIVHGKMKPDEKDREMKRFVDGETHIMVATTVIEVGVNVPNASIMIIESAERFGLSQLHQLRGRVGRGAEQSFCVLVTGNKLSQDARLRIKTMCETNDGFVIAETDLQLRGPGDLAGTQQSGVINLKIADLARDGHIAEKARNAVSEILSKDEMLVLPEHHEIIRHLNNSEKFRSDLSRIS